MSHNIRVNNQIFETESEEDQDEGTEAEPQQLNSPSQSNSSTQPNVNMTPQNPIKDEPGDQMNNSKKSTQRRKRSMRPVTLNLLKRNKRDKDKKLNEWNQKAGMKSGCLLKYFAKTESSTSSPSQPVVDMDSSTTNGNTGQAQVMHNINGANIGVELNGDRLSPVIITLNSSDSSTPSTPDSHQNQDFQNSPPAPQTPSTSKNPPKSDQNQHLESPVPKASSTNLPSTPDKNLALPSSSCVFTTPPSTPYEYDLTVSKPKSNRERIRRQGARKNTVRRRLDFSEEGSELTLLQEAQGEGPLNSAPINPNQQEPLFETPSPEPGPSSSTPLCLATVPINTTNGRPRTLQRTLTAESNKSSEDDGEELKLIGVGRKRKSSYSWDQKQTSENEPKTKKIKTEFPNQETQTPEINVLDPEIHKDIIYHAVLEEERIKISHRKSAINKVMSSLDKADPLNDVTDILDGISKAFHMIEDSDAEPSNCYFYIIRAVLEKMSNDKAEKHLKLCENYLNAIFTYVEKNLDAFDSLKVKLHLPMMSRLFQGPEKYRGCWQENIKTNFKGLIEYFMKYGGAGNVDSGGRMPESNFKMMKDFLNWAIKHYLRFDNNTQIRPYISRGDLVELFVETTNGNLVAILPILKNIADTELGLEICQNLVVRELFELAGRSDSEITNCLKSIIRTHKSLFIDLAKSELDEPQAEEEQQSSSLLPQSKRLTKHKYGNSELHKLCGKLKKTQILEEVLENLEVQLNAIKAEGGNVNITDNFGNTSLHDAVFEGRLRAVQKLISKTWNPKDLGSSANLNLLAQNIEGDTPLHISISQLIQYAESRPDDETYYDLVFTLIRPLIQLSPQEFLKLIRTKNKDGHTPFSQALVLPKDSLVRANILQILNQNFPDTLKHELKYANVEFRPDSLDRLWWDEGVQQLIECWRYFYDECS